MAKTRVIHSYMMGSLRARPPKKGVAQGSLFSFRGWRETRGSRARKLFVPLSPRQSATQMVSASPQEDAPAPSEGAPGKSGGVATPAPRTSGGNSPHGDGGGGGRDTDAGPTAAAPSRDEIYSYEAAHTVYALAWSVSWKGSEERAGRCGAEETGDALFFPLSVHLALPTRPLDTARAPARPPGRARLSLLHNSLFFLCQCRADDPFRLAVGSFVEDYPNRVDVLRLVEEDGGGGDGGDEADPGARTAAGAGGTAAAASTPPTHRLRPDPALGFAHPYPPSRIAFCPDRSAGAPDLIATSGDFLRIWQVGSGGGGIGGGDGAAAPDDSARPASTRLARLLTNAAHSAYCAPLTALDWNAADTRRLGTASIDTTCTVWDVEAGVADAQLVAHDGPVHDLAWGGVGVFASASADGSVRVFDLRDREHSTIIYEAPGPGRTALLRLAWNRADPRYLATLAAGSGAVALLDIRLPTLPVAVLARHTAPATALAWAPHSAAHMCTAGDDGQALIWDLGGLGGSGGGGGGPGASAGGNGGGGGGDPSGPPGAGLDPVLAYSAGAPVAGLAWSSAAPDWVAVAFGRTAQVLRV